MEANMASPQESNPTLIKRYGAVACMMLSNLDM